MWGACQHRAAGGRFSLNPAKLYQQQSKPPFPWPPSAGHSEPFPKADEVEGTAHLVVPHSALSPMKKHNFHHLSTLVTTKRLFKHIRTGTHALTSGPGRPKVMASGKKKLNVAKGPTGWGDAELVAIQAPTTTRDIGNARRRHKREKASSIPPDIKGVFVI